MLENGKMGLLRRVFKGIFTVNRILRPANLKDYRNKSGNDGGVVSVKSGNDRRGEVVAFGDDRCLKRWFGICCNFFKYPSPDTNVSTSHSRGEVYNDIPFTVIRGLRPVNLKDCQNRLCVTSGNDGSEEGVAKRFTGLCPRMTVNLTSPAQGEVTGLLRCARNDVHCLGRSMIEMLGVLAIIGVLSVGGIAGYSKAMNIYKLNRLVEQYTYLFQGLIEHRKSLVVTTANNTSIRDEAVALGLVPTSWNTAYSFAQVKDETGNYLNILSRSKELVLDLTLSSSPDFSAQVCEKLMLQLFQPLHSVIHSIDFFDLNGVNKRFFYYGDTECFESRKCLRDMDVAAIHQACNYCAIKEGSNCFLVIYF